MGKGSECGNRKTSQEAVAVIWALMMVAWARVVAVGVMRNSWILERACWIIFGVLREEEEAGITLRFWACMTGQI